MILTHCQVEKYYRVQGIKVLWGSWSTGSARACPNRHLPAWNKSHPESSCLLSDLTVQLSVQFSDLFLRCNGLVLNILRIFSDLYLPLRNLSNFRIQIMSQFPIVLLGKEWNAHYKPSTGVYGFTYPIPLTPATPSAS